MKRKANGKFIKSCLHKEHDKWSSSKDRGEEIGVEYMKCYDASSWLEDRQNLI